MTETGMEVLEQMEKSVKQTFWGVDAGQKDTIYLVTPFNKPVVVKKHFVGRKVALCPGEGCPACRQGERPDEFFCYTVWSERYGRIIASLKFSKQGVLKSLYKRFKRLNPEGTAPEAIKTMRGDCFSIDHPDAFTYEVEYVENRLDQVDGVQEFTSADIIAKSRPKES